MKKKDYYKILGIDKKATAEEIKKSYHKLSLKWHPDKWGGKTDKEKKEAEEKFKDISEAYSILSDENKRKQYDMFGTVDFNGSFDNDFDPFESFMNRGFGNFKPFSFKKEVRPQRKGTDIKFTTKITIEELYNNSKHTIKYKRYVPCEKCEGVGTKNGKVEECPHCHGTGVITEQFRNGFMTSIQQSVCPYCHGTGEIITEPCPNCKGSGLELVEETFTFKVPIGCPDGAYTIVKGAGNYPERNEGIKGDLQLVFKIIPNDNFSVDTRNPFNLVTSMEVPILDCITGCSTEILDVNKNKVKVVINPYTKHKDTVILKEKGLMKPDGRRGNLIITINQKMPKNISNEDKKIIDKLKKSTNFK